MAVDKVRFVGEEVVAVVAIDEDTAEEALELIRLEYEPRPPSSMWRRRYGKGRHWSTKMRQATSPISTRLPAVTPTRDGGRPRWWWRGRFALLQATRAIWKP